MLLSIVPEVPGSIRPVSEPIYTERLALVPMTHVFLRASLDGDLDEAARQIGLSLPPDWPSIPEILTMRLWQLEADPTLQPWLLRAIGLRRSGEMVGHIGFHAAPGAACVDEWCPGGVEFGFAVSRQHRRNGYAREASTALMDWAMRAHGVPGFVLSVAPENAPSQALTRSLGFVRVGMHLDEVDGPEDVFVRRVTRSLPSGAC